MSEAKPTGMMQHIKPDADATLAEIVATAGFTAFPWKKAMPEFLEWINLTLARAWPKAKLAAEKEVRERLGHEIKDALPGFISDHVSIDVFKLGDKPPFLSDATALDVPDALSLRMHVDLMTGVDFSLSIGPVKLGAQEVSISADLIAEMTPFIGDLPIVGALRVFFVDPPEIAFSFSGVASVANLGLMKHSVRSAIGSIIASQMVTPNSLVIPIAETEDAVTQRTVGYLQPPIGVLRVHPESAARLADSDWNLSPRETCDAYLTLQLGSQKKTSSTVKGTVNPVWPKDETHDFVVFSAEQMLRVDIYDDDWTTDDDYLGCIHYLKPNEAVASSGKDLKLFQKAMRLKPAAVVTSGTALKLRSEWLRPSADRSALASGALIIAHIGMLEMPKDITTGAQLRLKFGDLSVLSPLRRTLSGVIEHEAKNMDKQIKDIIVRGQKMGLSSDDLAALTGTAVGIVDEVVVQSKAEPKPQSWGWLGACCGSSASTASDDIAPNQKPEFIDGNTISVSMAALLNIALPAGAFERGGDIELELLDITKTVLASTSFPIGDVPLRWPLPDGSKQLSKLKGMHAAAVEVSFSVAGLVSGAPPDK